MFRRRIGAGTNANSGSSGAGSPGSSSARHAGAGCDAGATSAARTCRAAGGCAGTASAARGGCSTGAVPALRDFKSYGRRLEMDAKGMEGRDGEVGQRKGQMA